MPGWVDRKGRPTSWEHYVTGLSRLSMLDIRDRLGTFDAVRMAGVTDKEALTQWRDSLKHAGGL